MTKNQINKISVILAIVFITLFSSNVKAQSYVHGPTTVTVGEMNYFYIIPSGGTIAPDGYWFTSDDSTHRGFLYGNELSYRVYPEGQPENGQDKGITFSTPGIYYIHVYYGGPSNVYDYASLKVTAVAQ